MDASRLLLIFKCVIHLLNIAEHRRVAKFRVKKETVVQALNTYLRVKQN